MEVSSVQEPAGRSKLWLKRNAVTGAKVPRGQNSTGPPRASVTATPYREPRIRDEMDLEIRSAMAMAMKTEWWTVNCEERQPQQTLRSVLATPAGLVLKSSLR